MCIKVEQQLLRRSSSKREQAHCRSFVKKVFKKEREEPFKDLAKEKEKRQG